MLLTPIRLLAIVIVFGEWTGLARAIFRAPVYAAALDLVLIGTFLWVVWRAVRDRPPLRPHALDVLVGAYAVLALIQILNPNVPSLLVGLEGFRKTAFTMIGYGIVRLSHDDDPIGFYRIVAIGSVAAFLWSLRQAIAPLPIELDIIRTAGASPISFQSGPVLRGFAPTAGPFHLGILGGAMAVISVVLARVFDDRRYLLIAALAGAALGISLTRANMIGAIAALAVVVMVWPPMPERVRMAARAVVPIVALGIAVTLTARTAVPTVPPLEPGGPGSGGSVVTGEASGGFSDPFEDRSLRFQFAYWATYVGAIAERPLIGYGTSAAGDGFDRLYIGTGSENFEPHSLYLKAALELGVLGFALFITLLLAILVECRRAYRRSPPTAVIGVGLLALTMVSGISGPMLDAYPFNLLFWAAVGWLVPLTAAPAEPAPREPALSAPASAA